MGAHADCVGRSHLSDSRGSHNGEVAFWTSLFARGEGGWETANELQHHNAADFPRGKLEDKRRLISPAHRKIMRALFSPLSSKTSKAARLEELSSAQLEELSSGLGRICRESFRGRFDSITFCSLDVYRAPRNGAKTFPEGC